MHEENRLHSASIQNEIINHAHEGIGLVDTHEIIQFCNPAFAQIFEVSLNQLIGQNLLHYFDILI